MNSEKTERHSDPHTTGPDLSLCLKGCFLLFFTSVSFRTYILITEHLHDFSYLAIRGVLNDLTLPFAFMFIALHFNRRWLYKIATWASAISVLLISADFYHFSGFKIRINSDLFANDMLIQWIRSGKVFFLCLLAFTYAAFRIFNTRSTRSPHCSTRCHRRKVVFLLATISLFAAYGVDTSYNLPVKADNWDEYLSTTSSLTRSSLGISSFHCLSSLNLHTQTISPIQLFFNSHFADNCKNQFDSFAAENEKLNKNESFDKIWLHMGYHNEQIKANSVHSVAEAFASGHAGVELDIHYISDLNQIIVCHDLPESYQDALYLDELLKNTAPKNKKQYFWLDFKNLSYSNASEALQLLSDVLARNQLLNNVLVESSNPFMVRKMRSFGLKGTWGVFYGYNSARFDEKNISTFKSLAVLSKCEMVSLPWETYDENAQRKLGELPVAVYTVNDFGEISRLMKLPQVRIVLTDLNNALEVLRK